jgi:hypothetical protein
MKYFIIISLLLLSSCASRVHLGPDVIYGNNEIDIPKPEIE